MSGTSFASRGGYSSRSASPQRGSWGFYDRAPPLETIRHLLESDIPTGAAEAAHIDHLVRRIREAVDREPECKEEAGKLLWKTFSDLSTTPTRRRVTALILAKLFAVNFFPGDPYEVIYKLFSAIPGCIATKETEDAIELLLSTSGRPRTSAADALLELLRASASYRSHAASSRPRTAREEIISRTAYVSRLEPTITVGKLRKLFDDCGQVVKVRICGDNPSRTKYAFVEFAHPAGVTQLLTYHGKTPFGPNTAPLIISPARTPIQDQSDNDATFDRRHRKVAGKQCKFGLRQ